MLARLLRLLVLPCLRLRCPHYLPYLFSLYLHALSALPVRLALSMCLVCLLALFLRVTNKLQRDSTAHGGT